MSILDLFRDGNRPDVKQLVEYELREQLSFLWGKEQEVKAKNIRESSSTQRDRHARITELTEELVNRKQPDNENRVMTGAEQQEDDSPKGTQAVYRLYDGRKIAEREMEDSDPVKTAIWVVDDLADGFDENSPWPTAYPLKYAVGGSTARGGITGNSFRSNHPLKGIGTSAGDQVFEEDLMNLHPEFQNLVKNGMPDFDGPKEAWTSITRDIRFYLLVNDGKKYDLKATNTDDGTPSYAAIVIGEWSFNNDRLRRYDDYGNISYGAFGTYAGYTEDELLDGSDTNQQGKLNGAGDELRDQYMMQFGIDRYGEGHFN